MIPFPWWMLISLLGGPIVGAGLVAFYSKYKGFKNIKRIAIHGAPGVGKTVLWNYLQRGKIPDHPPEATSRRTTKGKTTNFVHKIKIEHGDDIGGGKYFINDQEENIKNKKNDLILYLFKMDQNGKPSSPEVLARDGENLYRWLDGQKKRPVIVIVGTHCDLDLDFPNIFGDGASLVKEKSIKNLEKRYQDYFEKKSISPSIQNLRIQLGGTDVVDLVFGSLKSNDHAFFTVLEITRSLWREK